MVDTLFYMSPKIPSGKSSLDATFDFSSKVTSQNEATQQYSRKARQAKSNLITILLHVGSKPKDFFFFFKSMIQPSQICRLVC